MSAKKHEYTFRAKVWLWSAEKGSWHFVTLPKPLSKKLKARYGAVARGFRSLKVAVRVGETTWDTSLFPDNKREAYILPLKASVRKAEDINLNDTASFVIKVRV